MKYVDHRVHDHGEKPDYQRVKVTDSKSVVYGEGFKELLASTIVSYQQAIEKTLEQ